MLIFENHGWQKDSDFPDSNFLEGVDCEQPKWVIPDNSELSNKIMINPHWDAVTDGSGNLIDIVILDPSGMVRDPRDVEAV